MPYEEPQEPDLIIETDCRPVEECVERMVAFMEQAGVIWHRGQWRIPPT